VLISGRNFTPGRPLTLSIGGPSVRPHSPHVIGTIDAYGRFATRIGVQVYPDADARRSEAIMLSLSTGPDESTAVMLQITG
jgi:hypothetical protein